MMVDILSAQGRSERMRRIRSTGNETTELALARVLKSVGLTGWRRHIVIKWNPSTLSPALRKTQAAHNFRPSVAPDFVFNTARIALFVDGCFWHACPLHGRNPSSNATYWVPKLIRNRLRDKYVDKALLQCGWTVLRVWEHELVSTDRLTRWLLSNISAV